MIINPWLSETNNQTYCRVTERLCGGVICLFHKHLHFFVDRMIERNQDRHSIMGEATHDHKFHKGYPLKFIRKDIKQINKEKFMNKIIKLFDKLLTFSFADLYKKSNIF